MVCGCGRSGAGGGSLFLLCPHSPEAATKEAVLPLQERNLPSVLAFSFCEEDEPEPALESWGGLNPAEAGSGSWLTNALYNFFRLQ